MKRIALVGLGLGAALASHTASALSLVDHTVGLKLLAGADVWSTPSNIPPGGENEVGFAGNAGGVGYGAMPYYELRIIKLVGVEAGINYEHGAFHRNVTVNAIEYRSTIAINAWRLPILAKLNIPLALGRFWIGLGPEFTLSQSQSGKLENTSAGSSLDAPASSFRDIKPTYLTGGLGLVIEIPATGLEIPVEFRASNNLSQPSSYAERTSPTLRAESSWVYRLGVGIGYQF